MDPAPGRLDRDWRGEVRRHARHHGGLDHLRSGTRTGHYVRIIGAFDSLASGSHWGQVAVNHLRERVNVTLVVLSIPAIIVAVMIVGIHLN